jgi:hypothetical protein
MKHAALLFFTTLALAQRPTVMAPKFEVDLT